MSTTIEDRRVKGSGEYAPPLPDRQQRRIFLEEYAASFSLQAAAAAAGLGVRSFLRLARTDREFAREWDRAREDLMVLLEEKALELALQGSETLLKFVLKARQPEKYDDHIRREYTLLAIERERETKEAKKKKEGDPPEKKGGGDGRFPVHLPGDPELNASIHYIPARNVAQVETVSQQEAQSGVKTPTENEAPGNGDRPIRLKVKKNSKKRRK